MNKVNEAIERKANTRTEDVTRNLKCLVSTKIHTAVQNLLTFSVNNIVNIHTKNTVTILVEN